MIQNRLLLSADTWLPIIGGVSMSVGSGMLMDQRYSYDFTGTSQSISHRRRVQSQTATVSMAVSTALCSEQNVTLSGYIEGMADVVGEKVTLIWNGSAVGDFIITSASFSPVIDAIDGMYGCQIGLDMTEGRKRVKEVYRNVSIM